MDTQKIFEQARIEMEKLDLPKEKREEVLLLLDLLVKALEADSIGGKSEEKVWELSNHLIEQQELLLLLKQQTEELNALRSISLNLTSSLDFNSVLEAVVTEAMRLITDANDSHIFLYNNDVLSFGSSLDSSGKRDKLFSEPRQDGLTYTVARKKEMIIVEDMQNHELFTDSPVEWIGSIIGIPLMFGTRVVGVMNLARLKIGGYTESEVRLMKLLADQAAIAIVNARLHEAVLQQALG